MAHASVAERGRPRGSRFPFDTEGSASAEARRRPLEVATGWSSARVESVAGGEERPGLLELATELSPRIFWNFGASSRYEIPKPMVVALLKASRGRHGDDDPPFADAAQLLEDIAGGPPA